MSSARFQKPQVCRAIARRKVNHQEFLLPTLSASKEWNAKSAIKPQWPVLHQIAKIDIKYETEIHHWCFGPAECENTPMIVSENIKDVFKSYWKLHNRSINVSKMLMRKLTWYPKESYTLPQLRKIDSSLTKTTSTPFSSQPQRCLTFWWIEPKMLLNKYRQIFTGPLYPFCIFTSMRHLFIWLRLGLFVSYLRDLFFIFIFIINYTISLK